MPASWSRRAGRGRYRRWSRAARPGRLAELLDDVDQFVGFVAVLAGELDERSCLFDDSAVLWCAGDGDAPAAAELEQALVAELAQRSQDGVGVDAEDVSEVLGGWESL